MSVPSDRSRGTRLANLIAVPLTDGGGARAGRFSFLLVRIGRGGRAKSVEKLLNQFHTRNHADICVSCLSTKTVRTLLLGLRSWLRLGVRLRASRGLAAGSLGRAAARSTLRLRVTSRRGSTGGGGASFL